MQTAVTAGYTPLITSALARADVLEATGFMPRAAVEPRHGAIRRGLGGSDARRRPGDGHAVAAARHAHAQGLLDPDQVAVVIAQQQWQQHVVPELQCHGLAVGAGGRCGRKRGGVAQAGASSSTKVPERELGSAAPIFTGVSVPISAAGPVRCTGWR